MAHFCAFRFDAALDDVPGPLREALARAGVTRAGVFRRLLTGEPEDALGLARQLLPGAEEETLGATAESLLALHGAAGEDASAERRRFAHMDPMEIMERVVGGAGAKQARIAAELVAVEIRRGDAEWKPALRPGRYRLRGDARLAAASGPVARATAEGEEREKWRDALVTLLLEAGGPIVESSLAAEPRRVLAAAAGGRRARTLAKRIRAWQKLRTWCLEAYGSPYPGRPLHLIEYAQSRADEPCGLSALQSVAGLYAFAETWSSI